MGIASLHPSYAATDPRWSDALSPAAKAGLVRVRRLQRGILLKAIGAAILLALGALPPGGAAFAQAKDQARDKAPSADRPLLATFCDATDIKGSACKRAKGYRSGKRCDVKLQPDRYSGKFLADGSTLLVVNTHADKDTIETACTKGFPRPKEIFGELGPGEAYVPPGHEKKARFVIDLTTSKVVPGSGVRKTIGYCPARALPAACQ
jgi:hypothetical protein